MTSDELFSVLTHKYLGAKMGRSFRACKLKEEKFQWLLAFQQASAL